jgi:DNA-binding NtrC family response regulator
MAEGIVQVAPLRERQEDIVPLARTVAFRARGREVDFTPAAERALRNHPWPGNVRQLQQVMKNLALRHDVIDVQHLPADVMSDCRHPLSRIQAFERDEIVRMIHVPALTMRDAAERLGMSRSTLYRKISQYGIQVPGQATH